MIVIIRDAADIQPRELIRQGQGVVRKSVCQDARRRDPTVQGRNVLKAGVARCKAVSELDRSSGRRVRDAIDDAVTCAHHGLIV